MTEEYLPKTFEEYCEMYGEPDYVENSTPAPFTDSDLPVTVIDHSDEAREEVDASGCVYQNKAGALAINYGLFVDCFAKQNELIYSNGQFYTPTGSVSPSSIRKDIANSLQDMGWTAKLDTPTNSLFQSLKDKYAEDELPVDLNVVPFANGDLHIDTTPWEFHYQKRQQTPYRLTVDFSPLDTPMPLFQKWLDDVFAPEDHATVQQMLGYLLLPTTQAQEAFFLVGEGGVGKSVLGVILETLFGNAYQPVSTQDLVSQRFQLSQVENKLVIYDDDLGSAALTETATLKKLITADQMIPGERKYGDPYAFRSYARIVACANFMLSSLYDDSDGFWRRLHPIQVLPKNPARRTIRNFGQIIARREGKQIARWALRGLRDLRAAHYSVFWSDRSNQYLGRVRSENNYIADFAQDCLQPDLQGDVTSFELYETYQRWSKDNGLSPVSGKKFQRDFNKFIDANGSFFGTDIENNIRTGTDISVLHTNKIQRNGRNVRGFSGVSVRKVWKNTFVVK